MAQRRRDSQEGIFTKLKSDNQLDYVPTRTWVGNQIYLLSMLLAHNLGCAGDRPSSLAHNARETIRPVGLRTPGYPTASAYPACAGRVIRPQGQLTLSLSVNPGVGDELLHYLEALKAA